MVICPQRTSVSLENKWEPWINSLQSNYLKETWVYIQQLFEGTLGSSLEHLFEGTLGSSSATI